MPNIKTYDAPNTTLTPSERGISAWEQAGRRLGPLYNEAAQFTREAGKLAANNKAQLWPFDIMELYQRDAAEKEKAAAAADKFNPNIGKEPIKPDMGAIHAGGGGRYGDPNGQISNGAGALGQALGGGRQPSQGAFGAPPEDYTLAQGDLVSASSAKKAMAQYNSDTAQGGQDYQNQSINMNNYNTRYMGGDPTLTDQSGLAPNTDTYGNPYSNPGSVQPPPAPATSAWGNFFSGATSAWGNFFSGATGVSSGDANPVSDQ
jgi:hypothetical protein